MNPQSKAKNFTHESKKIAAEKMAMILREKREEGWSGCRAMAFTGYSHVTVRRYAKIYPDLANEIGLFEKNARRTY